MPHCGAPPGAELLAEASVKTYKRDYARVHPLPLLLRLRQIARWFDDYRASQSQLGLGMISPGFIRARAK
jgi:hypothetical protein